MVWERNKSIWEFQHRHETLLSNRYTLVSTLLQYSVSEFNLGDRTTHFKPLHAAFLNFIQFTCDGSEFDECFVFDRIHF